MRLVFNSFLSLAGFLQIVVEVVPFIKVEFLNQQTQFKKLKEKIEAAKRDLTEKSDTEIEDGSKHDFSSSNRLRY